MFRLLLKNDNSKLIFFELLRNRKKGNLFFFGVFKIIILIIYYIWKKEMITSIFRIWIIIFSNKWDNIKNFKLLKYITQRKEK